MWRLDWKGSDFEIGFCAFFSFFLGGGLFDDSQGFLGGGSLVAWCSCGGVRSEVVWRLCCSGQQQGLVPRATAVAGTRLPTTGDVRVVGGC